MVTAPKPGAGTPRAARGTVTLPPTLALLDPTLTLASGAPRGGFARPTNQKGYGH